MSQSLPEIYLARHGETAWSLSGQHTGLTDIPLTERGEGNARRLGERLRGLEFAQVFTSPLFVRVAPANWPASRAQAQADSDLVEWNYGEYEGKTSDEIRREPARLATVSRRLPGRRKRGRRQRPGRSRGGPSAGSRRRRAALFQRPFPARAGRPLVGAGSRPADDTLH